MTVSLVARHKVKDFATWEKVYDEAASLRQEGGVTDDTVHRDPDDANMVYGLSPVRGCEHSKGIGC